MLDLKYENLSKLPEVPERLPEWNIKKEAKGLGFRV